MDSNYSLADVRAATEHDNDFGGGAWWVILLFLFMGFGWNNNGKNYGDYATSASQQEILFGQHFGQINDRLTAIENGICDSTYSLNNSILNEGRNLTTQISECCCENRLATANMSAQLNQRTCDITNAIHAEGEATRALIQTNEMQALRDKVASLEMDNRMYGVVRYPNGYTYNAGASPFCACNGCNNI